MRDQLVAETSTWQHTTLKTNIHAPGGIRTYDIQYEAEMFSVHSQSSDVRYLSDNTDTEIWQASVFSNLQITMACAMKISVLRNFKKIEISGTLSFISLNATSPEQGTRYAGVWEEQ